MKRFPSRKCRAQRMGANVSSSTTSIAPARGAENIKVFQRALTYSVSRSSIPTCSLRVFVHGGSSASAPGRCFLSIHSKEITSQTLCGERHHFILDGAFFAHLLGANEVQPTTSFAPKRGAQNIMTLLKHQLSPFQPLSQPSYSKSSFGFSPPSSVVLFCISQSYRPRHGWVAYVHRPSHLVP